LIVPAKTLELLELAGVLDAEAEALDEVPEAHPVTKSVDDSKATNNLFIHSSYMTL
jgi:hypothetical protein